MSELTETLAVKACEVIPGDIIHAIGRVTEVFHNGSLTWTIHGLYGTLEMRSDVGFTVTRPVPDPCPRGRMEVKDGYLMLDGKAICHMERETINAYMREMSKRWNLYEDSTTAEIEAGEAGR